MGSNCPKCGASLLAMTPETYACHSWVSLVDGFVQSKDCVNAMARAEVVSLTQQLADARLLARAANEGLIRWQSSNGWLVFRGNHLEGSFSDGLPILTDEVRAALTLILTP